jgi:hypothetical protein
MKELLAAVELLMGCGGEILKNNVFTLHFDKTTAVGISEKGLPKF